MPMFSGSSSVLDRVKKFLPEIAQANAILSEKISKEGQQAVQIDAALNQCQPDAMDASETSPKIDNIDEHDQQEEPGQVVELTFAVGDFDQSLVAQLEEQQAAQQPKEDE